MIDLIPWCDRADQSAKNASEQFAIQRHEIDKREQYWLGYAKCVAELRRMAASTETST